MNTRTRNWVIAVLAILGVCALLVVGTIGTMAYFIASHVDTGVASPTAAVDRFDRVRQRFAGQDPIVRISDEDRAVVRPREGEPPSTVLRNLNVIVYDRDDERIVEVTVPFWLLRLLPTGDFSVSHDEVRIDSKRLHLTVEELERYGPSLVLDHQERRGTQVLVWTE